MIGAAIFDFDGTLVDTMPLHYEAYRRALGSVGVELDEDRFYRVVGGTAAEVIPRLIGDAVMTVDVGEIHRRKKAELRELLVSSSLPQLETAKLLDVLVGCLPLGLASSGSREGIELMLHRLGWDGRFAAIVTGDDVRCGKPDPEPFLMAAECLGVPADACVAFEDSDDGVAAARAAGMLVFDVRATVARR